MGWGNILKVCSSLLQGFPSTQDDFPMHGLFCTGSLWAKICAALSFLIPWCRVLLEKLTGLQLVKKFLAFHGTRRFITALTSLRHLSLSCASPIQSIYPNPTSWISILILFTHLRLGLPSGFVPSGFLTKTLYAPSPHPYAPHAQPLINTYTFELYLQHLIWLLCEFYHLLTFV